MSEVMLKRLTASVGALVGGIFLCLIMTVYTGVQESRERNTPKPLTIPLPAIR